MVIPEYQETSFWKGYVNMKKHLHSRFWLFVIGVGMMSLACERRRGEQDTYTYSVDAAEINQINQPSAVIPGKPMTAIEDTPRIPNAVAILRPTQGNNVSGTITLEQVDGYVQVKGRVEGLSPGYHGFHIHEYGDQRDPEGKSAGDHYSPQNHPHGSPEAAKHHAGDMGNILANDQGVAEIDLRFDDFKLSSVVGRSIVIHQDRDDLQSQPSGKAGARVAVGVICIAKPDA